ncbi:hypothetical protein [Brevundimonas sp. GCM10030266]|uniref:hypothetical protein n=1 Tax=Brevundimonas sp. GCM10030266 TaxID=3273386 RepID=UPI00361AE313
MRRAPCLTLGLATVALVATGLADAAQAQSAPPQYLQWAGRPEVTAAPTAGTARPAETRRRPNRVIPHGGAVAAEPAAPAPAPVRRTLTPATAWLRPPPAASAPAPTAPQPPAPAPVAPRATPDYLPDRSGQPVPAEVALPAVQPAPVSAPTPVDPYAPRRDAPIFRMQHQASAAPIMAPPPIAAAEGPADATAPEPRRVATVTGNPEDRPVEQGARYYSVHRQSGREPDAVTLPAPTYVDALTVTAPVTIASQDLAQPDPGPTLIRDAQGRTRIQPAAPEGDYQ